jgi:O-antigen biosynthesis protein
MDKIAICGIFKDEAPYLMEWLAFHKMIGIDLFVLYDNGSTDGGADLIRRSTFARNVTLIDWPHAAGQIPAYQDFCTNLAARFGWVAFIDLDEFIIPIGCTSIREALMRRSYADYSAILLQWLVYGPSGRQRRPNGLVVENYTHRLPEDFPASRHVKSLVRGKAVTTAGSTPHIINVSGPTCNTRGDTVLSYAEQPVVCHDVMLINHYFTKSREDWTLKVRRGKADAPGPTANPYRDQIYFDVERDAAVEDARATRFVPRLRALLSGAG